MGQDATPQPQPPAASGSPLGEPGGAANGAANGSHPPSSSNGASEFAPKIISEDPDSGASGTLAVASSEAVNDWEPALNSTPLVPPREPLGARIAALMGRRHTPLAALCMILLWCIVALPPLSPPESLRPGQIATRDILAPYATMLLDRAETEKRQSLAATLVPPRYGRDDAAQDNALLRLRSLLRSVHAVQQGTPPLRLPRATSASTFTSSQAAPAASAPADAAASAQSWAIAARLARLEQARGRWARALAREHAEELPPSLLRALSIVGVSVATQSSSIASRAGLPAPTSKFKAADEELASSGASTWEPGQERWAIIERAAQDGVRAVYGARVRADVAEDRVSAQNRIAASVLASRQKWPLGEDDIRAAVQLTRRAAREPNLLVDQAASRRDRNEASEGVRQVFVRVRAGEVLVRAGEGISGEKWAQLQDLGLIAPRLEPRALLAQALLCTFLVGLCAIFVSRMHPRILANPTLLWLCAAIPLLFLLFLRSTLRAPHAENVAIPLAATVAMLLTVLADARMGIIAGFAVSLMGAVMARSDLSLFVCASLLSWTGAMGVSGLSSRSHLLRAGILMTIVGGALHALLGLMRLEPWESIISMAAWGAASGVLAMLAMAALAMLLERPFGITTHLRLLELLSPNESVLQRMLHEAPGTYTHSMMVGQLSESAAKALGDADAMLCRAGGMYHDIGKLRRPFCFIENQTGDNVHDRIAPTLSALVIVAHVRDGLEAGRAMRLPTPILDIIAQHHGTSLISFFFEKAKSQAQAAGTGAEVEEGKFRYSGPRPQSKEAAIVMLADGIEASSRVLPDASGDKLRAHIHAMIQARLQEGELSESDLTLRDLGIIEDAFARILSGAKHGRIAYPGKADIERDLREAQAQAQAQAPVSLAKKKPRIARPARAPREPKEPRPSKPSKVQAALQSVHCPDSQASQAPKEQKEQAASTYSAPQPAQDVNGESNGASVNGVHGNGANGVHGNGANNRGVGRRR